MSVIAMCGGCATIVHQCKCERTLSFYRATSYNATHGISKASLSVRLSVKRVDCDKTKETSAHIVIPHERAFILVF